MMDTLFFHRSDLEQIATDHLIPLFPFSLAFTEFRYVGSSDFLQKDLKAKLGQVEICLITLSQHLI